MADAPAKRSLEAWLPAGVHRNDATGALESDDPSKEVISERYAARGLEGHRVVVRARPVGEHHITSRYEVDARGRLVFRAPRHPAVAWIGAGVLLAGLALVYLGMRPDADDAPAEFGGFLAFVGAVILVVAGLGSHVEVDPLTRTVTRLRSWYGLRFLKVFPLGDFERVRVRQVVTQSRDSDDSTSTSVSHPVSLKGPSAEVALLSWDYAVDARLFAAKVSEHVKLPIADEVSRGGPDSASLTSAPSR